MNCDVGKAGELAMNVMERNVCEADGAATK
jgi:hypothetical protein